MLSSDCRVCKVIRTYLLFAVPLIALVGLQARDSESVSKHWFARAELIDILAWGSLLALVLVTLYRIYEEYYLPRQRIKKLQEIRSQCDSSDIDEDGGGDKSSRWAESYENADRDG